MATRGESHTAVACRACVAKPMRFPPLARLHECQATGVWVSCRKGIWPMVSDCRVSRCECSSPGETTGASMAANALGLWRLRPLVNVPLRSTALEGDRLARSEMTRFPHHADDERADTSARARPRTEQRLCRAVPRVGCPVIPRLPLNASLNGNQARNRSRPGFRDRDSSPPPRPASELARCVDSRGELQLTV